MPLPFHQGVADFTSKDLAATHPFQGAWHVVRINSANVSQFGYPFQGALTGYLCRLGHYTAQIFTFAGKDSRPPGLGSSWRRGCPFYWKRAQPRVPGGSRWCRVACGGGAPAANGSVWEGTPWYPRFLYETKQQVQKKWKKKSGRCGCLARTVRTRLFSAMRALPLARATVSPVASVQPGGARGRRR